MPLISIQRVKLELSPLDEDCLCDEEFSARSRSFRSSSRHIRNSWMVESISVVYL